MSFHPHDLETRYDKIECQRRIGDHIWDFLHFDSPKRLPWLTEAVNLVLADMGDAITPENRAYVLSLLEGPPRNEQYAFWFKCLDRYSEVKRYIMTDDQVECVDIDKLAYFFNQILPLLCDGFKRGAHATIDEFVRKVRYEYVCTVPCLVADLPH